MRDGPIRRRVKRTALGLYMLELGLRRLLQRARGQSHYRLTGTCNGCGRCCERPGVRVDRLTFHWASLRWLVLTWHRVVNGFEYVGEDRQLRAFFFRCTHYDPATRLCDSYDSRPGMCRDYPLNLLDSAAPELFPECSYRVVHRNAARLRQALEQSGLPPEKLQEVARKLHLEE